MVILTPSVDDEKLPYVCQPHTPPNVLGLGTDWYIDVAVGKSSPYMFRAFRQDPMAVLLRCDGNYFLELKDGWLLDLADGSLITAAPTQSPLVSWAAFSICMSAEPPEEDTVVFRWPADA
jgi:hypothetical protein